MAILDGDGTGKSIIKLIKDCKEFWIAVAWATENDVWSAVQLNINKAKSIVVGIDFFQTSPKVIEWLLNNKKAKSISCIVKKTKGVFHPKIYLFKMKDGELKLIIGSTNLTYAAFNENDECCVQVSLKQQGAVPHSIFNAIKIWERNATSVGDFDIDQYKKDHRTKGRNIRKIAKTGVICSSHALHPDLLQYDFSDYYAHCQSEVSYDPSRVAIDDRLNLLDFCGSSVGTQNEFCCVAGVHPINKSISHLPQWGYFGNISQDKAFMGCVRDAESSCFQNILNLYNLFPGSGFVSFNVFEKFLDDLDSIVNGSIYHIISIKKGIEISINIHFSAGTRLLAMKRPDLFFCLNGGNREAMAYDFSFVLGKKVVASPGGHNSISNRQVYWDILQDVYKSTWYSSKINPKWNNDMQRCWRGRVAMLDALYY